LSEATDKSLVILVLPIENNVSRLEITCLDESFRDPRDDGLIAAFFGKTAHYFLDNRVLVRHGDGLH
jgi:hypothetical protein